MPLPPGDRDLSLAVGVDAATKSDCAAVVAVAIEGGRTRLVRHRIWTPRKRQPLDLEATVEAFLLELHGGYRLAAIYYDPYQMARSAATLAKAGLPMREYPQTVPNLTASSQHLFEIVRERRLLMYPDPTLRQHALNAVAVETARGWRLAKEKSSRKIDAIVALSFAARAALDYQDRGGPPESWNWVNDRIAQLNGGYAVERGGMTLWRKDGHHMDRAADGRRVPPPGWTESTNPIVRRLRRAR